MPRPESGRYCLICAEVTRQRVTTKSKPFSRTPHPPILRENGMTGVQARPPSHPHSKHALPHTLTPSHLHALAPSHPHESSTRRPNPHTPNPQPSTLNPQPSKRNPQHPSTLNPQPSTLNPQPSTVKRDARGVQVSCVHMMGVPCS